MSVLALTLAVVLGESALPLDRGAERLRPAGAPGDSAHSMILPITITKQADLGFGQLAAGASPGTLTVTPAGVRTAGGGASLGSGAGVGSARFAISGNLLQGFSITLPASTTLTGAGSMTVNSFTSNPSGSGTLGVLGTATVTVGATLQVNANQTSGSYTGTFNVTVVYN